MSIFDGVVRAGERAHLISELIKEARNVVYPHRGVSKMRCDVKSDRDLQSRLDKLADVIDKLDELPPIF